MVCMSAWEIVKFYHDNKEDFKDKDIRMLMLKSIIEANRLKRLCYKKVSYPGYYYYKVECPFCREILMSTPGFGIKEFRKDVEKHFMEHLNKLINKLKTT